MKVHPTKVIKGRENLKKKTAEYPVNVLQKLSMLFLYIKVPMITFHSERLLIGNNKLSSAASTST